MVNDNQPKGIRNISTFITADALLAAILLVWAQLWIQPSLQLWGQHFRPESGIIEEWFNNFNTSAGFGLMWTYSAVFLALLALAYTTWRTLVGPKHETPDTAIGLFAASLVLGLINVAWSIFSVTKKLITGENIYVSMSPGFPIYLNIILIISIVMLSFWGGFWLKKNSWLKYLPWLLELLVLFIAVVIAFCLSWNRWF